MSREKGKQSKRFRCMCVCGKCMRNVHGKCKLPYCGMKG